MEASGAGATTSTVSSASRSGPARTRRCRSSGPSSERRRCLPVHEVPLEIRSGDAEDVFLALQRSVRAGIYDERVERKGHTVARAPLLLISDVSLRPTVP